MELGKHRCGCGVVCGNFPALSSIGSVVASFVRALYQLCHWRLEDGILVAVCSLRRRLVPWLIRKLLLADEVSNFCYGADFFYSVTKHV